LNQKISFEFCCLCFSVQRNREGMKSVLFAVLLSLTVFAQATNIQSLRTQIRDTPVQHTYVEADVVMKNNDPAPSAAPAAPEAAPDPAPAPAPAPEAPAAPDAPAQSAAPATQSHSKSSENSKATIQIVPVDQRVVVGDKGKVYTPLLFNEHNGHTTFPADGMVKAAKVPRSDGEPIKPIVKNKDGTFTDASLQPLASPPPSTPSATVFVELDKRVNAQQQQLATLLAEGVVREIEIERKKKEIQERNELKGLLEKSKYNFDEVLDEVDAFTARASQEYHVPDSI